MRLLNAETLEFELFTDVRRIPDYIILSHTWGSEEVSYQDMCWLQRLQTIPTDVTENPLFSAMLSIGAGPQMPVAKEDITGRKGYSKIVDTALLAHSMGIQYIWVDTCCIDKTSSSELQEAINSMYMWYKKSSRCVVFLEDVRLDTSATKQDNNGDRYIKQDEIYLDELILKARWFYRGWTLQELIAPKEVLFYDGEWRFLASKKSALYQLSAATRIHSHVLATGDVNQCCIAQIMSWAAERQTTREEDMAYCLLGLFGIHMPMLYGEGNAAFLRLQLEILKTHPDDSIFAWSHEYADIYTHSGLLAPSPREFAQSYQVRMGPPTASAESTSLGIQLTKTLKRSASHPGLYIFRLNAVEPDGSSIRIVVRLLDSSETFYDDVRQFARVHVSAPMETITFEIAKPTQRICVRQKPIVSSSFRSSHMHAFHLRPYGSFNKGLIRIVKVLPESSWRTNSLHFIPLPQNDARHCNYVVVLKWDCPMPREIPTTENTCRCPFLYLGLGYDRQRTLTWCHLRSARDDRARGDGETLSDEDCVNSASPLELLFPNPSQYSNSSMLGKSTCRDPQDRICTYVGIRAALIEDRLSLIVDMDGLQVSI